MGAELIWDQFLGSKTIEERCWFWSVRYALACRRFQPGASQWQCASDADRFDKLKYIGQTKVQRRSSMRYLRRV